MKADKCRGKRADIVSRRGRKLCGRGRRRPSAQYKKFQSTQFASGLSISIFDLARYMYARYLFGPTLQCLCRYCHLMLGGKKNKKCLMWKALFFFWHFATMSQISKVRITLNTTLLLALTISNPFPVSSV